MAIKRAQLFAIINNAINDDVHLYLWSYIFKKKFTSLGYLLSTKIYTFQSFWSTLSNQKFRSTHIHTRSKSICLPTPARKLNTINVFFVFANNWEIKIKTSFFFSWSPVRLNIFSWVYWHFSFVNFWFIFLNSVSKIIYKNYFKNINSVLYSIWKVTYVQGKIFSNDRYKLNRSCPTPSVPISILQR